jgi:hypothetical protein
MSAMTSAGTRPATDRGLRMSGLRARSFPDPVQPLLGWTSEVALDVLLDCLVGVGEDDLRAARGTSMIAMSEALLDDGDLPDVSEFDTVLLAYPEPDLYHAEVAGCWLSDRLPGAPVPAALAQSGPGAVFTALRVADGLAWLGDLRRGMVLGFDQNAVTRLRDAGHTEPDAAVLLLVGPDGDLAVREIGDEPLDSAGPDPATLAGRLARMTGETAAGHLILGAGLAAAAPALIAVLGDQSRVSIAPASGCTGVWTALAQLTPMTEPVLLADVDPIGRRLHHCLVVPEAGR